MNDKKRNFASTEVREESEGSTEAVDGYYCSCSEGIRSLGSTDDVSCHGTIAIKDLS